MNNLIRWAGAFAVATIAALALTSPASAQATRTWISGAGIDPPTNPCSRELPCKTFAGAIAVTAAGGEIDVLDPGGFGAVTINKAITLANEGVGEAGVLVTGTNGITVNCTTDPNCIVILRGLDIDGGPTISNSLDGVRFIAGKALTIENCSIRNFTGGLPFGYGIAFQPSASQPAYLFVENSTITSNGPIGGAGGGIFVQPSTGAPTVMVSINHVRTYGNGFGLRTDSTNMTGGSISTAISDSDSSGNANGGVAAISGASAVPNTVTIARATIANNNVGLNANGSAASVHVGSTLMFDNATGAKIVNGGTIDSLGGNQFYNNPAGPGPTLTILGPF